MKNEREHWYFLFNRRKLNIIFEALKKELMYTPVREPTKKSDLISILFLLKQMKKKQVESIFFH